MRGWCLWNPSISWYEPLEMTFKIILPFCDLVTSSTISAIFKFSPYYPIILRQEMNFAYLNNTYTFKIHLKYCSRSKYINIKLKIYHNFVIFWNEKWKLNTNFKNLFLLTKILLINILIIKLNEILLRIV